MTVNLWPNPGSGRERLRLPSTRGVYPRFPVARWNWYNFPLLVLLFFVNVAVSIQDGILRGSIIWSLTWEDIRFHIPVGTNILYLTRHFCLRKMAHEIEPAREKNATRWIRFEPALHKNSIYRLEPGFVDRSPGASGSTAIKHLAWSTQCYPLYRPISKILESSIKFRITPDKLRATFGSLGPSMQDRDFVQRYHVSECDIVDRPGKL
jgi:hypothetical protein